MVRRANASLDLPDVFDRLSPWHTVLPHQYCRLQCVILLWAQPFRTVCSGTSRLLFPNAPRAKDRPIDIRRHIPFLRQRYGDYLS